MNVASKSIRRRYALLICLLLAVLLCGSSHPAPLPSGTISVAIKTSSGIVSPNARLELYAVADWSEVMTVLTLNESFAPSGLSLDELSDPWLAEQLSLYAERLSPDYTAVTNAYGRASFEQLPPALYLVKQDGFTVPSRFSEIEPFLVTVPITENGVRIFDIDASPKLAPLPEPSPYVPPQPWPTYQPEPYIPGDRTLPQTGLLMSRLLIISLIGALLFVFGWVLVFKAEQKARIRKVLGVQCMLLGVAFLASAVWLVYDNRRDEEYATICTDEISLELKEQLSATAPMHTDYVLIQHEPTQLPPMPTVEIDGREYIGYLELPTLEGSLPVLKDWSYDNLNISPCLYSGSYYDGSLVILAHNYERHFRSIGELEKGERVQFVDAENNVRSYSVEKIETLQPNEVDRMIDSEYDMTLFTCTIGGASRVTVRLNRAEPKV